MANLNIRNLSEEVHTALRLQAARAGRSMEAQARFILSESCLPAQPPASPEDLTNWVDKCYAGNKPRHVVDDLIKERRREAANE